MEKTDKVYPKIDFRCSKKFKKELEIRSKFYNMSPSQYVRMIIMYSFDADAQMMRNIKSDYTKL